MTLNEIVFNIKNLARGGRSRTNDSISNRQIAFWVNYYRALFIRRDSDNGRMVNRLFEQDLLCVEMELVNASTCSLFPSDCHVLRSKTPIPKTVRLRDRDGITYVGNTDRSKNIELVSSASVSWHQYSKYTGRVPRAYIIDDYLYITNAPEIEAVNVRGIFEDPQDAALFNTADTVVYDETSEYPIPADFISQITDAIMKNELRFELETKEDTTQDAKEN